QEAMKNGQPVTIITIVKGSRKNRWPTNSIQLRTRFGKKLFTMSMRMCSLAISVHDAQSRNTAANSTHCSSSHAFELVSKTLRMVALVAEMATAATTSHA